MSNGTHEQTINTALAEVLQGLGRNWAIRAESTGKIFEEGGRPDILIEKSDGWPVVLEAEVENKTQAEKEAVSRLGNRLTRGKHSVHAVVAVVYPAEIRNHSGAALRRALRAAELEYVLLTSEADDSVSRFPQAGWIKGGVNDLAVLIHRSSIPAWWIEALADALESGINRAEGSFRASHPHGSSLGETISGVVDRTDDAEGQARRMAMAIVADALIFHGVLREAELHVSEPKRRLKRPEELKSLSGGFLPSKVLDEWRLILEVNYWPIFHTASQVIRAFPERTASTVLQALWEAAEELLVSGVSTSHDLTGIVFQRLIADRKFLATFYTSPSAAALLAGLALPAHAAVAGKKWSDKPALESMRIGDFACGTGTLLSTAYQRFGLMHEIHGGDPEALHPAMMENGLVGLDVLAVAVHLTAAMLAGSYPRTTFEGECLLTMPYGPQKQGAALGSLDLLPAQIPMEIVEHAAQTAGGRGPEDVQNLMDQMGHGQFDLVIMNPPFTRATAREGERKNVPNPAFAAFGAGDAEQKLLAKHMQKIAHDSCGHGNAGMASFFTDLGHRKTAPSGTLALVLPLSALSGASWDGVRSLWRKNYLAPVIVTIAGSGSFESSFSADTGMAECLFAGRKKTKKETPDGRAHFAVLKAQPANTIEGEQIALAVSRLITKGGVRRLEDGPFGGTRIMVGDTAYGEIIDAPLPESGAWQIAGINDISLGQTAHQLAQNRLWVGGMSAEDGGVDVPVCKIQDIGLRGALDRDLTGGPPKPGELPRGPFENISSCSKGDAYPTLWSHNNKQERRLVVEPDSHCQIREIDGEVPEALRKKADVRWRSAARAHYGRDLRFNSQSIIVAMTPVPALGGRAWPTVVFEDARREFPFALWCNSTLGLLCHWWMSNKTQSGRGISTVSSIPDFMTLDVRRLTDAQFAAAETVFNDLSGERLLPFDQIDEDPARAELDQRLLEDILGLPANLCAEGGPMQKLRAKLAAEPQIHGGKQTRVVFTEEGEMTKTRTDRGGGKV